MFDILKIDLLVLWLLKVHSLFKKISFSISQKGNSILIKIIHLLFKPTRGIYYVSKTDISLVRMSSVNDIQKVINFFSFEYHYPLIGYKKDSYHN